MSGPEMAGLAEDTALTPVVRDTSAISASQSSKRPSGIARIERISGVCHK